MAQEPQDHTLTNRLKRWTPLALVLLFLLASGVNLASTVYKAPHHGSTTSSSQAFLDAVAPTVAVITVAAENRFGHPDEEVVARLQLGVVLDNNVLLTSEHGDIQFTTDGEKLWVGTER